nr:uncharacterized protein LOC127484390 [Oryctolagus cuniculus]
MCATQRRSHALELWPDRLGPDSGFATVSWVNSFTSLCLSFPAGKGTEPTQRVVESSTRHAPAIVRFASVRSSTHTVVPGARRAVALAVTTASTGGVRATWALPHCRPSGVFRESRPHWPESSGSPMDLKATESRGAATSGSRGFPPRASPVTPPRPRKTVPRAPRRAWQRLPSAGCWRHLAAAGSIAATFPPGNPRRDPGLRRAPLGDISGEQQTHSAVEWAAEGLPGAAPICACPGEAAAKAQLGGGGGGVRDPEAGAGVGRGAWKFRRKPWLLSSLRAICGYPLFPWGAPGAGKRERGSGRGAVQAAPGRRQLQTPVHPCISHTHFMQTQPRLGTPGCAAHS